MGVILRFSVVHNSAILGVYIIKRYVHIYTTTLVVDLIKAYSMNITQSSFYSLFLNYIFFYEWNNLDIYIECTNLIDMCSEVKTKFPVPKKSCLSIWGTVISHEAWAPGVWSWECTLHYNSANLGCDRPRCSVLTLSAGRAPASPAPARPAPALSSQHPNHASTD